MLKCILTILIIFEFIVIRRKLNPGWNIVGMFEKPWSCVNLILKFSKAKVEKCHLQKKPILVTFLLVIKTCATVEC